MISLGSQPNQSPVFLLARTRPDLTRAVIGCDLIIQWSYSYHIIIPTAIATACVTVHCRTGHAWASRPRQWCAACKLLGCTWSHAPATFASAVSFLWPTGPSATRGFSAPGRWPPLCAASASAASASRSRVRVRYGGKAGRHQLWTLVSRQRSGAPAGACIRSGHEIGTRLPLTGSVPKQLSFLFFRKQI